MGGVLNKVKINAAERTRSAAFKKQKGISMIIREINETDRQEYLKMSAEFYSSPAVLHDIPANYRENAFEEYLRGVHAKCFIFEEEGKVAGYGIVTFVYIRESGGLCTFFDELYVREQFRSRGFGRQFFDFVFDNFPAPMSLLEVEKENVRAISLYKRLGFSPREYILMQR